MSKRRVELCAACRRGRPCEAADTRWECKRGAVGAWEWSSGEGKEEAMVSEEGTEVERTPTERRVRTARTSKADTKPKADTQRNAREARHNSASAEHYSPPAIVEAARTTLGGVIWFDPFSCAVANLTVRAERYWSPEKGQDGFALLREVKAETAFVNPPGGKDGNESQQAAAWFAVAQAHKQGRIRSVIFVCFSLELLQVTQGSGSRSLPTPLDFPLCYPAKRVRYYRASRTAPLPGVSDGLEEGKAPPHASVVAYLPPLSEWRKPLAQDGVDRFLRAFGSIGRCVVPAVLPAQPGPTARRSTGAGASRKGRGSAPLQLDLSSAIPADAGRA